MLLSTSMLREGEWIDCAPPGPMPLAEFAYYPATSSVRHLVNGRTIRTGYAGDRQFQEDFGLFWGTTDDVGAAPRGDAAFSLAWLTSR